VESEPEVAAPPRASDAEIFPEVFETEGSEEAAISGAAEANAFLYKKTLAKWKDPLTLPHSRMSCAKWAKPWPGAKICIGHKYQWQFMYCKVDLTVSGPTFDGAKKAVTDCLATGAAVGAAAGIIAVVGTGGSALPAAMNAFASTFESCLKSKAAGALGIQLSQTCGWGNWE
jgi:hypothetical protein